jgi:hypothetical protein
MTDRKPGVTDRDHFAAAALAGLLMNGDYSTDSIPSLAYSMADSMLRERERTTHDAAPAATARTDAEGDRTNNAGALPGEGAGDISDSRTRLSDAEIDALEYVVVEGRIACMEDYGILRSLLVRVRPEWEAKADSLEAISRGEVDSPQPVAWIAFAVDGSESSAVYMIREQAQAAADEWGWGIAPLYRSPSLDGEERNAVEWYAAYGKGDHSATLRKLLERFA